MKKYLLIATAFVALASCSDDTFVGESNSPNPNENYGGAINFGLSMQKMTRGDIGGKAAADLLGNNFYVTGTKGTEANYYPTPTVVFDNYLVHYGINSAGTTESNTSDWEYVGIDQGASTKVPADYSRVKISKIKGAQTIKYWDYSAAQYDFFGFSTGEKSAVSKTNLTGSGENQIADGEIGVTAMQYGSGLSVESAVPIAYTFYIPTLEGLQNTYITDITEVAQSNYGKEVTLKFKNLGSKIRVALYETVPGYSVKDVKFYQVDGTNTDLTSATKSDNAYLIGADNLSFPTKGTVQVRFQHVGNNHSGKQDYDKADAQVTPVSGTYVQYKDFGALTTQLVARERDEVKNDGSDEDGNVFLGRTLPNASFAGSATNFYQTVFPNTSGYALTLRVDYTLVPIDGAAETIKVYGAKAVVPATYTKWLPNYAYTYIFKISDNTNGWTSTVTTDPAGLFPITFDAVVAEATDATGEQKTITTVSSPSITTYQKGHDITKNEYAASTSAGTDSIYVQVMNNSTLATDLGTKGKLYTITGGPTGAKVTEADVMDALNIQESESSGTITGRNTWILTPATATTSDGSVATPTFGWIPGEDGNPIVVATGVASRFYASAGTYAYVYDATPTPAPASTYIYTAVTFTSSDTTAPEGWSTGVWYTDSNGATPVSGAYVAPTGTDTKTYYKKYTNFNKVYGVKVIKVE